MTMCFKVASFESGGKGLESGSISILKRIERLIKLCRSFFHQFFKMIFVSLLGAPQVMVFYCASDNGLNLPKIKRFHYVIESAHSEGLDSTFDRLHTADHYNNGFRRTLKNER